MRTFGFGIATALILGALAVGCEREHDEPTASGHESNGGNYLADEFTAWGRAIYAELRMPGLNLLTPDQLKAFGQALDQTPVEVMPQGPALVDNAGNVVNARVMPRSGGGMTIQLDQGFWSKASAQDQGVCRLVFHEYLRVIGVDKDEPEDEYSVSGKWFGTCGEPQSVAATNLDFETDAVAGKIPYGWMRNSIEQDYEIVSDDATVHDGHWSTRMAMVKPKRPEEFGMMAQCIDASPYLKGGKIHFEGWLKTKDVGPQGAALWLRIDSTSTNAVSFDNMDGRNLTGTQDWTKAVIDLPVPASSVTVCFGAILEDSGTMWIDDLVLTP